MAAPPNVTRKSHQPNIKKISIANTARSAPGTTHNKVSSANRKCSKKHKHSDESEVEGNNHSEDEGLMASAFPHYCDRCGMQMLSANASYYLYCSDQCSRGDGNARPTAPARALTSSNLSLAPREEPEHSGTSAKRYVPKARPTPLPSSLYARIPPYHHESTRDLDPTEWKPAESGRGHGPHKRITLNNPYDFSQGYTEHLGYTSRDKEDSSCSVGIYPASMPNRKPTRGTVGSTPRPEIMRRVPSLSRASTLTASSPSSTESRLSDEVGSVVPAALSPKVGVANVSVSTVSMLEEMEGLRLEESKERYKKYPVQLNKRQGRAQGSLKNLLDGRV